MSTIAEEITALNTNLAAAKAAVTTAGGTVGDTGLAGLATEIATIPSGGGGEVESKYIDFYDYDGTRLYSWTKQELDNATELPANPTHAGLTSRGWNWTLAELREQGTPMDVGQMYRPTDGKTHLFVEVDADHLSPRVGVGTWDASEGDILAIVDWGDGSATDNIVRTGNYTSYGATHTYAQAGRYEVTIEVPTESAWKTVITGYNSTYTQMISYLWTGQDSPANNRTTKNANYARQVKEIWVGDNIRLNANPFGYLGIEKIVLSDTLNDTYVFSNAISRYLFYYNTFLRFIVIPRNLTFSNITSSQDNVFNYTGARAGYSFAYGCTIYTTASNMGLRIVPQKTATYVYISVSGSRQIYLPNGLASLNFFIATQEYIKYPASLASIPNFYSLNNQIVYPAVADFTDFTSVPTRASTSGPSSANLPGLVIKVPAALEADWKADASWSALADYIVGV